MFGTRLSVFRSCGLAVSPGFPGFLPRFLPGLLQGGSSLFFFFSFFPFFFSVFPSFFFSVFFFSFCFSTFFLFFRVFSPFFKFFFVVFQFFSAWADHLLSHLLCLIPRSLLDDICVFSNCSFHKHSAESRADQLEKDSLSASTVHLFDCFTISDQGHSLRVIHVLVGEGIARVHALRERIRMCSPCVIKPLPHGLLLARVDEFDCRGMQDVCSVVPLW